MHLFIITLQINFGKDDKGTKAKFVLLINILLEKFKKNEAV